MLRWASRKFSSSPASWTGRIRALGACRGAPVPAAACRAPVDLAAGGTDGRDAPACRRGVPWSRPKGGLSSGRM
ncbi:hypothetical protein [Paenibacillus mucilaginosus]|uniref:hypothetical protein n=1 Tax=Paenibacillus mucilaginosus TaxID=61624 RepID=UPI00240DF270|nr:hypothetical protein [Paenibacillus mucilaginosus]